MMLWFKALHIIAMVAWFAGLFYLPRLFVYHMETEDNISLERFKVMERRLYKIIMWPAAIMTTLFGLLLISLNPLYYGQLNWMLLKLILVAVLWTYHLSLGYYLSCFDLDQKPHSVRFFRIWNEVPTILLVLIILLVILKPF